MVDFDKSQHVNIIMGRLIIFIECIEAKEISWERLK